MSFDETNRPTAKELDELIEEKAQVDNEGAARPEVIVPTDDDSHVPVYEPEEEVEPGAQETG